MVQSTYRRQKDAAGTGLHELHCTPFLWRFSSTHTSSFCSALLVFAFIRLCLPITFLLYFIFLFKCSLACHLMKIQTGNTSLSRNRVHRCGSTPGSMHAKVPFVAGLEHPEKCFQAGLEQPKRLFWASLEQSEGSFRADVAHHTYDYSAPKQGHKRGRYTHRANLKVMFYLWSHKLFVQKQ